MHNQADYEGLDNRIVDLIGQYWMEEKRPLLLSQLGSRDGGEVARRAKSMMGSLGVYLRTRLSAKVNILQHSTKSTVVGAVPADAGVTETDTDHLLDRTLEPRKTDRRYHAAFWAAFRKPLEPSLRRYLHVDQPHHFRDADDEGIVGPGYTEIERSFIASAGADDTTVEESIRGWLEAKGMEAHAFYQVGRETTLPHDDLLVSRPSSAWHKWALLATDEISNTEPVAALLGDRTAQSVRGRGREKYAAYFQDGTLGRLLTVLDAEDLSRMTIPLDIVQKLRRKAL